MKVLFFLCALCVQLTIIFGFPSDSEGVGAFAYEDETGNRYGGTYELKDGKVHKTSGNAPDKPPANIFGPNFFPDFDNFFPSYFRNFENLLQDKTMPRNKRSPTPYRWNERPNRNYSRRSNRAFIDHIDYQQKALGAAEKAYELTSNQAGNLPQNNDRFPNFGGYSNFGNPYNFMPGRSGADMNAAYAGAFGGAGGYSRQIASINPGSPYQPNVDVVNYAPSGSKPGYVGVASKSYASSSNVNGKQVNHRGSETYVDQNGRVTSYKVAV